MYSGFRPGRQPPPPTDRTVDALLARADEKCATAKSAVLEGAWLSLRTTVDVARL